MWGPLLAYVLLPGFPPLGSCEAGRRLLRLHSGPFDFVFGFLHCLKFVHSSLHRFLSRPLWFHRVGTGICLVAFGLNCAWLSASLGFCLFSWDHPFCGVVCYTQPSPWGLTWLSPLLSHCRVLGSALVSKFSQFLWPYLP